MNRNVYENEVVSGSDPGIMGSDGRYHEARQEAARSVLSSLREVSTASAVDPEHWRRPRSLIVGSFSGSFDAARARCPQYGEQLVVVNGEQQW